ncbi:hypothetical protein K7640_07740 [Micromonospora sp. PLK6-60]|uniref:hypothetical protein n=1 Tax=Micromonospora sp. PLK6-60 TaxID=2873383 RepID=UPI001CA66A5B|nr:hypothetical protein [Micromonospora sp. PLK6-60]MBY8871731.1 hypothetical protein [Micromonospora sp. PLK6-60]
MLPVAIARPSWPATLRSLRSLTRLAVAALVLAAGLGAPAHAAAPTDAPATPIVAPVRADALATSMAAPIVAPARPAALATPVGAPVASHGPAAAPGGRVGDGFAIPAVPGPAFAPSAAVAAATGDPVGGHLMPTAVPHRAGADRVTGDPAGALLGPTAPGRAGAHRGPATGDPTAGSWHLVVAPTAAPAAGVPAPAGMAPASATVVSPVDPARGAVGRRGPPRR